MITNLLAVITITLTTNVSTIWPSHFEPDTVEQSKFGSFLVYFSKKALDENPDHKTEIVTVTKTTIVETVLDGKKFVAKSDEPVSETKTILRLQKVWIADPLIENSDANLTNWSSTTLSTNATNWSVFSGTAITNFFTR